MAVIVVGGFFSGFSLMRDVCPVFFFFFLAKPQYLSNTLFFLPHILTLGDLFIKVGVKQYRPTALLLKL